VRIRSIKPEFWRSQDVSALALEDRLLFIGLWSYVDDNGVGFDRNSVIAAELFADDLERDPRDTFARVSRGLLKLSEALLITRYSVEGRHFLYITNWKKHQRIDKPAKDRYPLPTCANAVPRDSLATPSRGPRETLAPGTGEQGSRGTGEEGRTPSSDKSDQTDPDRFEEFWDAYDKKVGRKAAVQKYRLALRKPGVTPDLLIAAATSYVAYVKSEGKHPTFTKHPESWLNGEHWNDERTARTQPQTRIGAHMALVEQLADAQHPRAIGDGR